MHESKRRKLEEAGWRVGSVAEVLDLTPQEEAYVELKLALADYFRQVREQHSLTQSAVAKQIGSSQSRVAKMESADPSVTVDLLIRSLLSLGVSREDLGRVVGTHAA